MSGKVALISGGARGIGKALALDLAKDGWTVAFCYRKSGEDAEKTGKAINDLGGKALGLKCDVSDPKAAEALVKKVEGEFGRIDVLVNAAGPYRRVGLLEETPEGWKEMFANNLDPAFYLSKAVAAGMKERKWGRIVNFAMAKADQLVAQPQLTAHYIAKVGVLVLTRSLAKLLAPHGITVNAVSPGFIDSGSAPAGELEKMVKNIPAGYIGKTDDALGVRRFLISDQASYVTGANLVLSGGWGL